MTPAKSSDASGPILALDASGRTHFSIALLRPNAAPLLRQCPVSSGAGGYGHVESLIPEISALLEAAETRIADVARLAVVTGPGSFSGARAGCATIRALGQAASLPMVGISVMELLAEQAVLAGYGKEGECLLPVLSAGDGLLLQPFRARNGQADATAPITHLSLSDAPAHCRQFAALALLGNGAERLAAAMPKETPPRRHLPALPPPDALFLASMAARREAGDEFPVPIYPRPPDVRLPSEPPTHTP